MEFKLRLDNMEGSVIIIIVNLNVIKHKSNHKLINLFTSNVFLSLVLSNFFINELYSAWSLEFYLASSSSSSTSVKYVLTASFVIYSICLSLCRFYLDSPSIISCSYSI